MTKENNNKLENLLKKKMSELTREDVHQLEKPLGTYNLPFPMYGSITVEEDGHIDREQALTFIAGDINNENDLPMVVSSERSYEEVLGISYRDMPVPSMLPFFYDSLERRRFFIDDETGMVDMEKSKGRLQFVVGDPGAGKSFMGAMMGRMRSNGPVDVLDCGGKNMRELLFETVLDFGAGDALPKAIDAKIAAGSLDPMSTAQLKALGEKFVQETEDGKLAVDWHGLSNAGEEAVSKAYETLMRVSKIEGLDNAGGNALGMVSQFGPAITSFIKGEELVLDEYNKSKEGTDDNLQTFLQFATGEIAECTVENPLKNKDVSNGPSHFTFRREDTKAGWFLTLTGNATEDGVTTRSLNKSVYSRLDPQTLAKPSQLDWQHRWCQMAMGLPLTTLYYTFKEKADKDPEAFTDFLKWVRTAGLSEDEVNNIPVHQMEMIENWQTMVQQVPKIAKVYSGWQALTDAEAIFDNGHDDLVDEVDPEFSKKHCIDFRKVIKHLEEALPIRPKMKPTEEGTSFGDMAKFGQMPERQETSKEATMLNFGTRWVDLIERKMYETSEAMGKPNLYKKLQELCKENDLRDLHLEEGAYSGQSSIESGLNIRPINTQNPAKQAELVQTMLCDHLREVYPDLTTDNEQIVTSTELQQVIKAFAGLEEKSLLVPNRDVETLAEKPFAEVEVFDTLEWPKGKELPFYDDEIVRHEDFMATVAMPVMGDKNVEALWNENMLDFIKAEKQKEEQTAEVENQNNTAGTDADANANASNTVANDNDNAEDDEQVVDESLYIAEGLSSTGLKTTTVIVTTSTGEEDEMGEILKEVCVHVVKNETTGKSMVVGEGLSDRLQGMFTQAGVFHVDRNDANAKTKIESALNDVLKGSSNEAREHLKGAFLYRNPAATEQGSMADMLLTTNVVDARGEPVGNRKYLVHKNRAA